jgi:peptidoglycan hydrolase-like protein with peptidoglycan-binding domain
VTRLVQQLLTGRGYNIGAVDGRLGEDTRRAIQAFETAQRLPPSGRISAALVTRLQRTATAGKVASGR